MCLIIHSASLKMVNFILFVNVMHCFFLDTYEMITEYSEGGYQFVVSYHFESNMRAAGERSHPSRVKRLAQEAVTLSTSLPLSYSSSVFVRCDTDRLDVMKVRHLLFVTNITDP